MSASLFFHIVAKIVFNLTAEIKMVTDKWTLIDMISCFSNIYSFNIIGNASAETIIESETKQVLDYYVIAVTIFSWIRFFSYFLVIREISKLLMTLFQMLLDTVGFILIVFCYLCIVATIFTTLFSHLNPGSYGSVTLSGRTLFEALLAEFDYEDDDPAFRTSFSILMMIHIFISNIFLLNYLIAIISTVYTNMIDIGEFSYKRNKYEFIEKYSIAMLDQWGYSELVVHPPPLNFLTIFLAPFAIKKTTMKKASKGFAVTVFWTENVVYMILFLMYEIVQIPWIFIRVIYNIFKLSTYLQMVPYIVMWLFVGPVMLIFGVFKDFFFYLKILCDY
jgi:hypothetical protein